MSESLTRKAFQRNHKNKQARGVPELAQDGEYWYNTANDLRGNFVIEIQKGISCCLKATSGNENEVEPQIIKAMISNREVALSIQKGKRFLNHLKSVSELNPVTLDQLNEVARLHHLHPDIAQGFLLSGVFVAYYITETSIEAEPTIRFEHGKIYRIYWVMPITDEMAYHIIASSLYIKRIEAYERFCLSYPQRESNNCLRCDLLIPIKRANRFCSDTCEQIYKQQKEANFSFKERGIRLFKSFRDFIKSINSI